MLNQAAQKIYNVTLNHQDRSLSSRIIAKLVNKPFNWFRRQNPLIETVLGKSAIKVPFSHQLPFILKVSPFYATNLARIARLVHAKYADLTFIDIGANIGDSVALLRAESTFPILCIEGDDYFFSVLQANASRFSDVHVDKSYVGESTAHVQAKSVEIGGTAHLSQYETDGQAVALKPLPIILGQHPAFRKSKMLKIDTDGFDNKIIRGSTNFLQQAKPVLFFEYDPYFLSQQNDDGLSIFRTLLDCGYRKMLIYDNSGELLLTADLSNTRLLEDIHHFYTGRKGLHYCDICAFHEEDDELFETVRRSEMNFFKRARS